MTQNDKPKSVQEFLDIIFYDKEHLFDDRLVILLFF